MITAVQDRLITPAVLADRRQRLDDPQPELLALLGRVHGDVLDVAHAAEPAEELALDEDGADGDDAVGRAVDNDDGVVGARGRAEGVELRAPSVLAGVCDDGEDGEDVEVAALVVRGRERADLCAEVSLSWRLDGLATYVELCRKLLSYVGGNLVGGEEEVELVVGRERHYGQ